MKSLAFILLVITVIGLFRPRWVLPFLRDKSKKKVLIYYGITFVIVVLVAGSRSDSGSVPTITEQTDLIKRTRREQIFKEIINLERQARATSAAKYPVYGSELTIGSEFVLSEETILMKELSPKDLDGGVDGLRKMPTGTKIEILRSIDSENTWRVNVTEHDQEGFIKKSALNHQVVPNKDQAESNQTEAFRVLKGKADSTVMATYNLTRIQLDSLELEGIKKGWIN